MRCAAPLPVPLGALVSKKALAKHRPSGPQDFDGNKLVFSLKSPSIGYLGFAPTEQGDY